MTLKTNGVLISEVKGSEISAMLVEDTHLNLNSPIGLLYTAPTMKEELPSISSNL
jgi:hypothetical protein